MYYFFNTIDFVHQINDLLNKVQENQENKFKVIIDKFMIINLFIIFASFLLFIVALIANMYGVKSIFNVFQRLWYPFIIPSLGTFFTAVIIESIFNKINKK